MLIGGRNIGVVFPGTRALDDVSFRLEAGEVLAVVGANGSGKTTLLSVLCGLRRPSSGSLYDDQGGLSFRSVRQALHAGVALVPQEPQLAWTLPCWENLTLGQSGRRSFVSRKARSRAIERIEEAMPGINPLQSAGRLRKSDRAVLALLAALERRPRVLALDEPTAVLGVRSVAIVAGAIERVTQDGGAVALVSHRLRDIVQLATRVAVLSDGRLVEGGEPASLSVEHIVDQMTLGKGITTEQPPPIAADTGALGRPVLTVRGLRTSDGLEIPRLDLASGEIIGIAGLGGSGRSRLLRVLSGSVRTDEGELLLDGHRYPKGLRGACRAGISYVPEDRVNEAIFPPLSVVENLSTGTLGSQRLVSRVSRRKETRRARDLCERFGIKAPGLQSAVTTLSGGNQQRVVLARALSDAPTMLVADEPTQGVDAAGRSAIHAMLQTYVASGGAVVMASSEFEEMQDICTRIIVIRDGTLVGEFKGKESDYRLLMELATGADVGLTIDESKIAAQ